MTVTFECPRCQSSVRAPIPPPGQSLACAACGEPVAWKSDAVESDRIVRCPLCGTEDLYVQKDFPHQWGLAIVAVGFLLSSIAWWQYQYPLALGILLVSAALDVCLYHFVGNVLVCYRCLSQYRGGRPDARHKPFDLGIGERYRQERIRSDLLRRARAREQAGGRR